MTVYSVRNHAVPPSGIATGSSAGTFGMIFTLSQAAALTGIWVYSSAVDSVLPAEIGIWDVATGTLVPGTDNAAPSWSGTLGSGWIRCAYNGSVTLDTRARGYIVTRLITGNHGFSQAAAYPVTSGILTAPAQDATSGLFNGPFNTGAGFAFPNGSGGAGTNFDWFADVEVTTSSGAGLTQAVFP